MATCAVPGWSKTGLLASHGTGRSRGRRAAAARSRAASSGWKPPGESRVSQSTSTRHGVDQAAERRRSAAARQSPATHGRDGRRSKAALGAAWAAPAPAVRARTTVRREGWAEAHRGDASPASPTRSRDPYPCVQEPNAPGVDTRGVRLPVPRLRRIAPLWRIRTARILLSKPYPTCMHPLRAPRRRSEAKRTEAASDNNTMSFSEPDTDIVVPAFDVRALARRAAVPAAVAAAAAAAHRHRGRAAARLRPRAAPRPRRRPALGHRRRDLRAALLRRLRRPVLDGRQPRDRAPRAQREHAGDARRRGRDAAAADRGRRRRCDDAVGAAQGRPRLPRRHADAAGLPHRALLGLPRRDRRLGQPHRARGRLRATGRSRSARFRAPPPRSPSPARWPWAPAGRGRSRAAPPALHAAADVFGAAVRDAIGHVRSGDPRLLGALAWWTFDAAVLWAMLHAFGAPPPFAVVVLAYFVGQVGNTIPIPGAVSGGIVGVLVAFAVPADLALVSVLAYRAIAIWLPAPIGLVALGALRRTMARWSAEDAAAEVVAGRRAGARARAGRAGAAPVPGARAPGRMRLRPATSPALPAAPARVPRGCWRPPRSPPSASPGDGRRRAPARPRGRAHRPLRHARPLDLRARRRARLPRDRRVRRPHRARRDGDRARRRGRGGGRRRPAGRSSPSPGWPPPLGDLASFALGQRLGRRFLVARGPRFGITAPRLERVEAFFDRHGPKAILVGRFIGIVRAVAPFLAGASGMRLRDFLPWSLLGTVPVGDGVHARRLRLPRVVRLGRPHADPRRLRRRGRGGGGPRLPRAPPGARGVGLRS